MKTGSTEERLLAGLAQNDKKAVETLYKDHFGMVQAFILNNNGSCDDARDIFQEAMIVLYEKATSGHFQLTAQIKTYLYSVSRRLWLKRLQQMQRFGAPVESMEELAQVDEDLEAHEKHNDAFVQMDRALAHLGEPCRGLLEAYYMQRKNMADIADQFGYTNAENAKNQKYKCLARLKKYSIRNIKVGVEMDEVQLQDAADRYLRNEMTQEERIRFEELRSASPEVDQMVVEHSFFLQELEKHSQLKEFRSALNAVEAELLEQGAIKTERLSTGRKVANMWRRYQRTIAVAACIGGITALAISGIVASLPQKPDPTLVHLVHTVNNLDHNQKVMSAQLNEFKTKIDPKAELKGTGTSFLIDGRGYLVTNAHVLKGVNSIVVQNQKGDNFNAKIVFSNPIQDLAILKIDDSDFTPVGVLPYGVKRTGADLGEPIFTLGYPRNEIVYNQGYLSARTGYNGDTASCQITISANPGNSGGPVLNEKGEVIGILSAKQLTADGAVFALKSKNIFAALDSLKRDTSNIYPTIHVSTVSGIKNLDRVTQIKKIEDCVYMVKGY